MKEDLTNRTSLQGYWWSVLCAALCKSLSAYKEPKSIVFYFLMFFGSVAYTYWHSEPIKRVEILNNAMSVALNGFKGFAIAFGLFFFMHIIIITHRIHRELEKSKLLIEGKVKSKESEIEELKNEIKREQDRSHLEHEREEREKTNEKQAVIEKQKAADKKAKLQILSIQSIEKGRDLFERMNNFFPGYSGTDKPKIVLLRDQAIKWASETADYLKTIGENYYRVFTDGDESDQKIIQENEFQPKNVLKYLEIRIERLNKIKDLDL